MAKAGHGTLTITDDGMIRDSSDSLMPVAAVSVSHRETGRLIVAAVNALPDLLAESADEVGRTLLASYAEDVGFNEGIRQAAEKYQRAFPRSHWFVDELMRLQRPLPSPPSPAAREVEEGGGNG